METANVANTPSAEVVDLTESQQPASSFLANIPAEVLNNPELLGRWLDIVKAVSVGNTPRSNTMAPLTTIIGSNSWVGVSQFPGRSNRVDAWFIQFETEMKSKRVPPKHWVEKMNECPKMGIEYKRHLLEAETEGEANYEAVRRRFLRTYGPADPVGYFRRVMHEVKGEYRTEVSNQLYDALALYNRAAKDAGREEWTSKDLLYPFANAFSTEINQEILKAMDTALESANPFRELSNRAPERETPVEDCPLVARVGYGPRAKRSPAEAGLVNAVEGLRNDMQATRQAILQAGPGRRDSRIKRPRGQCTGCGGQCTVRVNCPAFGKPCHNCGKENHFASVCRVPRRERPQATNNSYVPKARPFRFAPNNPAKT